MVKHKVQFLVLFGDDDDLAAIKTIYQTMHPSFNVILKHSHCIFDKPVNKVVKLDFASYIAPEGGKFRM